MAVGEDEFWENEEENECEVTTCFERYYNATRPTYVIEHKHLLIYKKI